MVTRLVTEELSSRATEELSSRTAEELSSRAAEELSSRAAEELSSRGLTAGSSVRILLLFLLLRIVIISRHAFK